MKLKIFLLTLALGFGATVCAPAQSTPDDPKPQMATQDTKPTPDNPPQSLADAAKEKPTAKKAKRVFTNDDIPSRPEEAAASGASEEKDAAAGDADKSDKSGDAAADKDAKKPPEDSIEVKGAKKVVEAKTIQIDAVTDEMKKLEYDLANAKTPDEASSIAQSIRNLQHNIEVWKNVRDDAQKVVDSANKPKPQPGQ
jgi:hypothetical protein